MGNYKQGRRDQEDDQLYVTVPSFFRCPISLDVMTSPVSLCTGITYDRSSIQRWLDAGHNVCPATMQPLPSTHNLVPNHTLHRLIRVWASSTTSSSSSQSPSKKLSSSSLFFSQASSLIDEILTMASTSDYQKREHDLLLDRILKLVRFASESTENVRFLSKHDALVTCLVQQTQHCSTDSDLDLSEAAVMLLDLIARSYYDDGKQSNLFKLQSLFLQPESLSSSSQILLRHDHHHQYSPNSKIAIADLLRTLVTSNSPNSQITVVENESIITQLINGLNGHDFNPTTSDRRDSSNQSYPVNTHLYDNDISAAYLSCLLSLSSPKTNKIKLVRAGLVPAIGNLLNRTRRSVTDEEAVRLVESLCGCGEGRKAVATDERCVSGIMDRILRVSREGSERCVAVLWGLCCVMKEEKAREAVAVTGNGGVTKLLLMMQSGCSPVAKRMCGDLLRVIKVGAKPTTSSACLAGYDSKTSHIMPF